MALISTHCFLLPIKWDFLPEGFHPNTGKNIIEYDTKTDLEEFNKKIQNSKWERQFYKINNDTKAYNELTYYHSYTANTIFDMQQADEISIEQVSKNKNILYYELPPNNDDYYKIYSHENIYTLKVSGISMHVVNTGVAIISINLENHEYSQPHEILAINELGRRIYPQFLGNQTPYTKKVKEVFLATKIELCIKSINNGIPIIEDFSSYDTLAFKETHYVNVLGQYEYNLIVEFPNHIKELFPTDIVYSANDEIGGNKIRFNIVTDDRMFFMSWYGDYQQCNLLNKIEKSVYCGDECYSYTHSDFWYQFLYGDRKSASIANKIKKEKDLQLNTYDRWVEYGTLYGCTRDSFVCISDTIENLEKVDAPDISIHMKSIYYEMAVLCLIQRASVLRFSAEVSGLADLGKTKKKDKEISLRIQDLYLNYIEFMNKIYFREITPQIQGIEMYTQLQNAMHIHKDIEDLDREIKELHEFAEMLDQKKANKEAEFLNKIALVFLPATLLFGILGSNFFDNLRFSTNLDFNAVGWISIGLSPSVAMLLYYYIKLKKDKHVLL